MAIIVVGGHSRNIGKSSVVAELISAFPARRWTAIKITQYGHGLCSLDGHHCECAPEIHPYEITEERNRSGRADTCRFLAAGAERALWVRVRMGQIGTLIGELQPVIETQPNVIIESNSILKYVRPDLYIVVLRYDVRDWKESAREYLPRADAAVLVEDGAAEPVWQDIPAGILAQKPIFPARPPQFAPDELISFVRSRLER